MTVIKPISVTRTRVTIARADWDALIAAREDAEDAASFAALEQRLARDKAAVLAEGLSPEAVLRILAGETPLRLYREKHGLTQQALADVAGVSTSYLNEIETGRKPGGIATLRKLAAALGVSVDALLD